MLKSILESIKYSGYLYPVSFLRIVIGYDYLITSLTYLNGNYLYQPLLAASIRQWLPKTPSPIWLQEILENIVIPNWQIFAYLNTYLQLFIGISLIIGLFVRPATFVGIILAICTIYASGLPSVEWHQMKILVLFVLFWLGAGRCLGIDYYFYKSRRGLWW